MKAIVFEGSRAYQWNGRAWMPIRPALADARIREKEAFCYPSRERAEVLMFIPPFQRPTPVQRRKCNHEWVSIGWMGYPAQVAAGWRYRCRKCGGYRR